ncbi:MAG: MBL fold metallo-hydrolase [Treponema sp.]|jgi:hydroxyacylglutathione hydrolase|nr:MBL fold metallo-hydrolase [Treponema sp.]
MKIYFHLNISGFSNCYVVVNEISKEAIIIDPGQITEDIISQIEDNGLKLSAVLITHNHGSHVHGLKTLRKIYSPKIFAADWEVAKNDTTVITGDGKIRIAKMIVRYMALPGHTADSMIYGIGNALFTGDVISAGMLGSTNSSYSDFILQTNIQTKIFSQQDSTILLPGHGPPTTLKAAKLFNIDIKDNSNG